MANDLILIHSGNKFPDHINDCIKILNKQNFNIHLILENKFHHLIPNSNVILVDLDKFIDSRYLNYKLHNYDNNFRDNFFSRTSSRFIILDNYTKEKKLESYFHIENDIALFDNLDLTKKILENLQNIDTALILDHPYRCVPSLLWFRSHIAATRLANFIYENNQLDDMKNIALYFYNNKTNVTNLPLTPFHFFDRHTGVDFGNLFDQFNSIFDGAAIGQYLYGIDTLDNISTDTKGFVNETSIFKPNNHTIIFDDHIPYIIYRQQKIKINNLHIHSKQFGKLYA